MPTTTDRTHLDPVYADALTQTELDQLPANEVHDRYCDNGYVPAIIEDPFEIDPPRGAMIPCRGCDTAYKLEQFRHAVMDSGIGERYFTVRWSDLEMVEPLPALKNASDRITDVLATGHSALLAGPPGTGKTQAAALLVKAALWAGRTAALENIGSVAMRVRAGYDNRDEGETEASVVRRLSKVDLLVVDDVGAGEAGDGKIEKRVLYFVLEARQNARRSTILTSNLPAKDVSEFLGARIMNRLMPLQVFAFAHGKNFRKPTGENAWLSGGEG